MKKEELKFISIYTGNICISIYIVWRHFWRHYISVWGRQKNRYCKIELFESICHNVCPNNLMKYNLNWKGFIERQFMG